MARPFWRDDVMREESCLFVRRGEGPAQARLLLGCDELLAATDMAGEVQYGLGDEIRLELYPQIAPNTVANFVSLAQSGFYDGLIFHRVIPGFMIQGGDPQGTGMGGPGYAIKGEFSENNFKNDLKHTRGVISMARSMANDSAGSQFFIMHADAPHLDGQYAAFGKVIEGMDAVDAIAGGAGAVLGSRPTGVPTVGRTGLGRNAARCVT